MKLSDLQSLDFQNVGSWPLPVRMGAIALIAAIVLGAGYTLDTQSQLSALEAARNKEQELKRTFESQQGKAGSIDAYRQQMKQMEYSFGALLRQLPSKTEVAELLVDISSAGITSGLEFELFRPEAEKPEEFYAELPINIRVRGRYHDFGSFVSGVAQLPRIVTLHDFAIAVAPQAQKTDAKSGTDKEPIANLLIMETTAKTYRYLDENEIAEQSEKAAKAKAEAKGRK